ncbi:hypothetical protein BX666DRAFT_811331 [Dichotomocladium elegans]|nr:hypothetical protein BX666DRAFT_811331 [Dichotomocladium elegans]
MVKRSIYLRFSLKLESAIGSKARNCSKKRLKTSFDSRMTHPPRFGRKPSRARDIGTMTTFWKELAVQRTADVRLQHFYADEAATLEQTSKRQKIFPTNTTVENHKEDEADESESPHTDEDISTSNIYTWAEFMAENEFSDSHLYSLERAGIIQCGVGIKRSDDVPGHLYDQIDQIDKTPAFPFKQISQYITSVLHSKDYVGINHIELRGSILP